MTNVTRKQPDSKTKSPCCFLVTFSYAFAHSVCCRKNARVRVCRNVLVHTSRQKAPVVRLALGPTPFQSVTIGCTEFCLFYTRILPICAFFAKHTLWSRRYSTYAICQSHAGRIQENRRSCRSLSSLLYMRKVLSVSIHTAHTSIVAVQCTNTDA